MKVTELIWLGQRLAEAGRAELQASAPDVPVAELIVMGDLLDNAASSITEIAARTGYVQSRVSTAVAKLVERGWAAIGSDPADGRRTLVSIPEPTRKAALKQQRVSQARTLDALLTEVPATRRAAIIAALDELVGRLRSAQV